MITLVIIIILLALLFDFYNGMNDAANSIATIVSTRVLSPKLAVLWAAIFNFLAAFFFGVKVAKTMGKGIIDPSIVDSYLILMAVVSGIIWTAIATHLGLPISVSHSLIGGMVGAGIAKAGLGAVIFKGIFKVLIFIFLSPIIGFFFGIFLIIITTWIVKDYPPSKIDKYFRIFQLFSAASYSLGHGTNDAQKTMGIIAILLYSNGMLGDEFYVPFWVVIICHLFIALGTLVGGWAVIKTLGMKITKLRPIDGFAAETASALTLFGTAHAGIPVSTTHTITGAIVGVGSTKRLSAVRWGVAGNVVLAWIFTIPFTFFISYLFYKIFL
ncbi:MAG: inorganic phosphate transporter [Thermoanaerobaculia bacterium]